MPITGSLTKVPVVVDDIATVITTYNRIRLYRSISGISGTYSEITATAAAAATLTGDKKEPFVLNTKPFVVKVDGTEESFVFGASTTAAAAAAEITANTSLVASDASGYVKIVSPTTTTSSTIEFADASTGALALGFYETDNDHGEEVWSTLVGGTKLYVINDYQGADSYWYKTKYYSTSTLALSDFSVPFQGRKEGSLDPAYIIYGTGYLVDTEGVPMESVKVFIYNKFIPKIVSNKIVAGVRYTYTSGEDGYVQIPLVKGSTVTMSIENTRLVRDIDVPATGDTFDLMTTDIQDAIGIVSYDLPDATRVTL